MRKLSFTFLIAFGLLGMVACQQQQPNAEVEADSTIANDTATDIEFAEPVAIDTTLEKLTIATTRWNDWEQLSYMSKGQQPAPSIKFDLRIELPKAGQNEINQKIRKCLIDSIFSQTNTGVKVGVAYADARNSMLNYVRTNQQYITKAAAEERNAPEESWQWEIKQHGKRIDNNSSVVTYCLSYETYFGGPHGDYGTIHFTFNAKTGKIIRNADLWKNGSKTNLDKLLVRSLKRQMSGNTELLNDIWYDDVHANDNFQITPDSILFTYNTYEIAPYSDGAFLIGLSAKEAMPYINPNGILATYWKSHK